MAILATLVGEDNPRGGDPKFALYPAPEGCAGERLCCVILGMYRKPYLDLFERVNLCPAKWNAAQAKKEAASLAGRAGDCGLILLGSKVAGAFGVPFEPFTEQVIHTGLHGFPLDSYTCLVLPHPSGRNRMWNDPANVVRAREAVLKMIPALAVYVDRYDALLK